MQNYYKVLQVTSDATASEIETACDAQYNYWRRMVTHHDPSIVNRANQSLQLLETIRVTLTDPAKRAAYDATLNLSGAVSGLADPQAQPVRPVAPPLPPRPSTAPQAASPAARLDAWQCSKCHTASPVGTRYCRHCGDEIGRDCPKCGKLIEKSIRFCPECGVEVKTYIEEKQRLAEEYAHRQQEEARRQAEEHARREAQEREQRQRRDRAILYVIVIFVVVITVCVSLWVVGSFAIEMIENLIRHW